MPDVSDVVQERLDCFKVLAKLATESFQLSSQSNF